MIIYLNFLIFSNYLKKLLIIWIKCFLMLDSLYNYIDFSYLKLILGGDVEMERIIF